MSTIDEAPRRPATRLSKVYFPELDGMRALAVIGVIAFHLNLPGAELGWLGVPFFFALSGFLITGILVDSRSDRGYFRNFYLRRVLRIFPVYYLVLALLCLLGSAMHNPPRTAVYYLFYVQNYYQATIGLYDWRMPAFGHTWSLAVEEQFYLIWPMVCYILAPRKLFVAAISLMVIGLVFRSAILHFTHNPYLTYTPLPGAADQLASGALAALMLRSANASWLRRAAWMTALAAVTVFACLVATTGYHVFGTIHYLDHPWNTSVFTVFAIASASLITFTVLTPGWAGSRILRTSVLVHLGRISYGLYLYHVPVLWGVDRFWRHIGRPNPLLQTLAKCCLTYLFAVASYYFFERRFLLLKERLSKSASADAVIFAAAATGDATPPPRCVQASN